MEHFEAQLAAVYSGVERYVKYRLNGGSDAEDLVQDICLTAYLKYDQLEKKESFKPWILSIARSRCADYSGKSSVVRRYRWKRCRRESWSMAAGAGW